MPRIIDKLRKAYPGPWVWHAANWWWVGPNFHVYMESHNYSDVTGTHDIHYIRSDTGQPVPELLPRFNAYVG